MRKSLDLSRRACVLSVAVCTAFPIGFKATAQTPLRPPVIKPTMRLSPQRFAFQSLNGQQHTLADFKGKVIIVNVWGTWCAACLVEMPSLTKLMDYYKNDSTVSFILLSQLDSPDTLRNFVERQHRSLPVYYVGDRRLPKALEPHGWPATFLIDRTGTIRGEHFGGADRSAPAVMAWIEHAKNSAAAGSPNRRHRKHTD